MTKQTTRKGGGKDEKRNLQFRFVQVGATMEEDEERIVVVKTEAAEEEEEVNDYKDHDLMEAAAEEGEEVKLEEEEDKKPLRGLMLKRKIDGVIGEGKIIANCFARFGCKRL